MLFDDGTNADAATGKTPMKQTDADREVADSAYRVTAGELRSFIERVERLKAEVDENNRDIKEVFVEAKSRGYDVKVLRKIIAERKRDANELSEENAIADLYRQALGM